MIILIDGPSGAGKSSLADRTVTEWQQRGLRVALVRMDEIYRGWTGLDAASESVVETLIKPFSQGLASGWRRWDWVSNSASEWAHVEPGGVLIIEGCGALSRASARYAAVRVWLDADDVERKRRALDRDGEVFAAWWEIWQQQFELFVRRENPRSLATVVLDGTAPGFGRYVLDPGYGEQMTTPPVETHYRVEFVDGPLEGQTEDRLLVGGKYDKEFTTIAAVEGLESSFLYRAVDERTINGQLHVRYSFDPAESDPVQGDEDEGDSLTI